MGEGGLEGGGQGVPEDPGGKEAEEGRVDQQTDCPAYVNNPAETGGKRIGRTWTGRVIPVRWEEWLMPKHKSDWQLGKKGREVEAGRGKLKPASGKGWKVSPCIQCSGEEESGFCRMAKNEVNRRRKALGAAVGFRWLWGCDCG